jgi:ferrous iron transport protein A
MVRKAFGHRKQHAHRGRHLSDWASSGEDSDHRRHEGGGSDQGAGIPLNFVRDGQTGRILELQGHRGLVGRLASLGFTPGANVRMLQNHGYGPLIVEVRDVRIALGRGEAAKIRVELNGGPDQSSKTSK